MTTTLLLRRLLFASSLIVLSTIAHAQTTFTSSGNGNWTSVFNSSGSGSVVTYVIQAGDTVTVNTSSTSLIDTVIVRGSLVFGNGKKVNLNNTGFIHLESGGVITGGNGGSGFRFSGGAAINGAFNEMGLAYATANTTGFTPGSPLPVSWLNINANLHDHILDVSWRTALEVNNSHFSVELSADGHQFESVGTVPSLSEAGNSAVVLEYSEQFELPSRMRTASTVYVRVIQLDFDGEYSYSKVIAIRLAPSEQFQVLSKSNAAVIVSPFDAPRTIQVFTMKGSLVQEVQSTHARVEIGLNRVGYYVIYVYAEGRLLHVQKTLVH